MTGRAQWPLYALAAARESDAEMAGHHGCETPNGRANAYGMQESAVAYPSMFDEDGPQVWECNDASRLSAPACARLRIGNVQVRVNGLDLLHWAQRQPSVSAEFVLRPGMRPRL